MAFRVVEGRVSKLGFCCPLSYFYTVRNQRVDEVAKELSVSERTVKGWRALYRKDKLECYGSKECFFASQTEPLLCRGSAPRPYADHDPAPAALLAELSS